MLDDAIRIDDEGCAQRHAFFRIQDAQLVAEIPLDVGHHGKRQVAQVFMVALPSQVDELTVGGHAENLGVAVRELAVQTAELGDFRGTDEGEVFRPEEHHLPLAFIRVVRHLEESFAGVLWQARVDSLKVELGEFIANGEHGRSP